jgi:two-component sensor histidine kinase
VLSDNGIGFPPELDWSTTRSLGLRLVRALAQQLQAKLEIQSENGTEVKLVLATNRKADIAEAHRGAASVG